jgi:hypothetical protein
MTPFFQEILLSRPNPINQFKIFTSILYYWSLNDEGILSTKLPLLFMTFSVHKELLSHSKQELELDYQNQKWLGVIEPDSIGVPLTFGDILNGEDEDQDPCLEEEFER